MAQLVEALPQKPEVVGLIPYGVIGLFLWHIPSCRSMDL
jgi:hypothetical protein